MITLTPDQVEARLTALKHAVERAVTDSRVGYAIGRVEAPTKTVDIVAEAEAFYRFLVGGSPKTEQAKTAAAPFSRETREGYRQRLAATLDANAHAGEEAFAAFAVSGKEPNAMIQLEHFYRAKADALLEELHRAMPEQGSA